MGTRWPTRTSIGLGIVVMLVGGATASAQELSFSLSLDATTYGGDAYKPTNGDRGGELAIAFQMMRGLKLGGGVFVGKFDEPISDPSFTAVSLFFEPAWVSAAPLEFDHSSAHAWRGNTSGLAIGRAVSGPTGGASRAWRECWSDSASQSLGRRANCRLRTEHGSGRPDLTQRVARAGRRILHSDLGAALNQIDDPNLDAPPMKTARMGCATTAPGIPPATIV